MNPGVLRTVAPEVLASPLGHPEGPDVLRDGTLVFVEADSGRLCAWRPGHAVVTIASTGGGPYGCTVGSDDHYYVTQSGIRADGVTLPRPTPPSIQRISPDGANVSVISTHADGRGYIAPNDLAWGIDGRLFFTDSGNWMPASGADPSRICALRPDGIAETVLELGPVFANGIAAEADGSIVWLESYTRVIGRLRPDGRREVVTVLAEGLTPEGLAVAADGTLWVTTFEGGTVEVLAPDGTTLRSISVGGVPVNCCFDDGWLYLADFGEPVDARDEESQRHGRMLRIPVDTAGLVPVRGAIELKG